MKTSANLNECTICKRVRSPGSIDHAGDYICMGCTDECEGHAVRAVYLAIIEDTRREMHHAGRNLLHPSATC